MPQRQLTLITVVDLDPERDCGFALTEDRRRVRFRRGGRRSLHVSSGGAHFPLVSSSRLIGLSLPRVGDQLVALLEEEGILTWQATRWCPRKEYDAFPSLPLLG